MGQLEDLAVVEAARAERLEFPTRGRERVRREPNGRESVRETATAIISFSRWESAVGFSISVWESSSVTSAKAAERWS